jgi:hypothetical protein
MKKLILTVAAAMMVVVGAQAQGYFVFNTRPNSSTVIKFFDTQGTALSGDNYHVQVFAGPDANSLLPVVGDPLDFRTDAAGAGLTSPFLRQYTVAQSTLGGGATAFIGYQAYHGDSLATADQKSDMITTLNASPTGAALTVSLQVAPNLPNTVNLGSGNVSLVPEPTTLALDLLGLGSLLMIRRRK